MKRLCVLAVLAVLALAIKAQQSSELNEADRQKLEQYQQQVAELDKKLDSLQAKVKEQPERMAEIREKAMAVYEQKLELELRIIRENPNNLIPVFFIKDVVRGFDYDQLKELCDSNRAYYHHPAMELPKRLLANMEKRAPGKMYMDMTISDQYGNQRKLSDWVGKGHYVLIDFWASWCGPCRQEMPNVVANYEKYHSKGFEIIGISFDQNADAWKKAVEQMKMKWPQLSDLGGWKSAAASVYGISAIPASLLLDGTGKIVAGDLRGDKLGEKLMEIYGF